MSFRPLIERLLGVRPPEAGQGLDWSISQSFPLPAWGLALLVVGLVAFVWLVYRTEAPRVAPLGRGLLAGLRLLAWACLLFFLSEAILSIERTGLPHVAILVDTSGSMATRDGLSAAGAGSSGKAAASRLELVRNLLTENNAAFPAALLTRHKLRLFTVGAEERALGPDEIIDRSGLDDTLTALSKIEPAGDQSRLGDALRQTLAALRGSPPAALIYFTDGVVTDGEKLSAAARFARQNSVVVYPVAVGDRQPARDIELHDTLVDEVAFVDDPVTVLFKLSAEGIENQSTQVRIRLLRSESTASEANPDGSPGTPSPTAPAAPSASQSGDEAPLVEQMLELPAAGKTRKYELVFTPKDVGEFDLVIDAVPVPGETNPANNLERRRLAVRKERTRVLLVDRQPRWEFRELKALLEREKTVDLKVVLQEADPEFAKEDRVALPEFPVRKEALFEYDVLILGDINPAFLNSSIWDNLREFVRDKGGGLVFIAGREQTPWSWRNTPLEPLLPIDLATTVPGSKAPGIEPYRPEPTSEGLRGVPFFRLAEGDLANRKVWDSLPGWYGLVESPDVKKGAQVLMSHPRRMGAAGKLPVIAMQRFGAGKCVYHASDETWRWRFRTGDLYYGRYWVQLIRYLSRSKLLGRDRAAELIADRQSYRVGEPVLLRVRYLDDRAIPADSQGTVVTLDRAGHDRRELILSALADTPTVFETQIPALPEGTYQAWISSPSLGARPPTVGFRVESTAREARVLQADYPELSQLAKLTGGKLYSLADAAKLPSELPPGTAVPLETDEPIRLWNHWLGLTLFMTFLSLEWLLRKRWQLP